MAAAGLTWRWTAPVAACGVAMALAACGGGEEARLSHADFVRQADVICDRSDRESHKLDDADVGLAELLRRTDELVRRSLDDLHALRPPARDQAAVDRWLGLLDSEERLFADDVEAVKAKDNARQAEIGAKAERLERRAERMAREIGLRSSCAGR